MFGLVINANELLPQEAEQSAENVCGGVKVWIKGEKSGLGPGGYELFRAVESEGSVKRACAKRGLSYSKGWKIINGVEREMGFALVERKQGGAGGGEARLTEQGKQLLELYDLYYQKVACAAKEFFSEVFEGSGLFEI